MLNRVANFFVRLCERWMPDPFVFCVLLTAICYGLAWWKTPASAVALVGHWYKGLWEILPFAMQMVLVLLTGYTLASSAPAGAAGFAAANAGERHCGVDAGFGAGGLGALGIRAGSFRAVGQRDGPAGVGV